MDDLNQKISDLLGSPEGMARIQSMMEALGLGGAESDEAPSDAGVSPPPSAPPPPPPPAPASQGDAGGLPDMSVLLKLAPLLGGMNKDDENTVLLKALRPYLHGDREKRLDDAIKIMQMMKVLPLLQGKDIL